jgi:hypothetical protein
MTQVNEKLEKSTLESTVITKAVLKAASNLQITNKTLAKIIGLSEPTVSRMRANQKAIGRGEKAFELAALLVRLYRSLDAITGGDDVVSSTWLKNKNTILNACPLDMIQSVQGLISVIQYLDSRRAII